MFLFFTFIKRKRNQETLLLSFCKSNIGQIIAGKFN